MWCASSCVSEATPPFAPRDLPTPDSESLEAAPRVPCGPTERIASSASICGALAAPSCDVRARWSRWLAQVGDLHGAEESGARERCRLPTVAGGKVAQVWRCTSDFVSERYGWRGCRAELRVTQIVGMCSMWWRCARHCPRQRGGRADTVPGRSETSADKRQVVFSHTFSSRSPTTHEHSPTTVGTVRRRVTRWVSQHIHSCTCDRQLPALSPRDRLVDTDENASPPCGVTAPSSGLWSTDATEGQGVTHPDASCL